MYHQCNSSTNEFLFMETCHVIVVKTYRSSRSFIEATPIPPPLCFLLSLMPAKRPWTVSSLPTYDTVIWTEEETARGAKITAKVSNSPKTPRIKKRATPFKKRRTNFLSLTPAGPSNAADDPPTPPMPIALKKPSKKVGTLIPDIRCSK